MGRSPGCAPDDLPVTEDTAERLLRLPFYFELADGEIDEVAAAVADFFG